MATVTVENSASFGPVKPVEHAVPPLVAGVVFGGRSDHQVGDYARSGVADTNTLHVLSIGVLDPSALRVLGRKNTYIGIRHPVGGGGGSRENGSKGNGEREKQCATPGCRNMVSGGGNHCYTCQQMHRSNQGRAGSGALPRRRHAIPPEIRLKK